MAKDIYNEAVGQLTDTLLSEDVHDYLRKLAKKGIQKIGTADFASVLSKYGDKKEKEIFAGQNYSGKSIDLKSLFGGLTSGIHERVAKERTAHPYRMGERQEKEEYFPSSIGHIAPEESDNSTPELRKERQNRLLFRRDKEIRRIQKHLELDPEYKDLKAQYSELDARSREQSEIGNSFQQKVDSDHESRMSAFLAQHYEAKAKNVTPLENTFKAATAARKSESQKFNTNPDHDHLNVEEFTSKFNAHMAPFREAENSTYSDYSKALTAHEDAGADAFDKLFKQKDAEMGVATKLSDEHYRAHIKPLLNKSYALGNKIRAKELVSYGKEDRVHEKYSSLMSKAGGVGDDLYFSNYTEHVAQAENPVNWKNRSEKSKFDGGHWPHLRGTTEFDVITSDLDHPHLGKTLFVHEIQSDLHQKTKNDSPIGDTWREHALAHVHKTAHEGGYEHVMFAPASVQFVNNGGKASAADVSKALNHATESQKRELHSEMGTLNPETASAMLRSGAGDLAKRYHSEIFPTANKVFGHEPTTHPMSYKRDRGSGEAERHEFPVYKVQKNIDAVEEEFKVYTKNKLITESIVQKLLA